jgi:DNA-binding NtrC family response regulator
LSDGVSMLVVEDDEAMRDACSQVLTREGYTVAEAVTGNQAMEVLGRRVFDLVILDVRMPGPSGMEILAWLKTESPATQVIVITGYATVDLAVEAMKAGAADFLAKPFPPDLLRHTVERALRMRRLTVENAILKEELGARSEHRALIGSSQPIRLIRDIIERVGPTDSTVLVTGESGTGKEVVARRIRERSARRDKPFVVVDCGALVGTLFESELFGHMKGSFTGATGTKHGRLELASTGTIFFDEIGNVSTEIQAKLLRVIQEREFTRVGSARVIPVNVRILAATSKNMLEEIKANRFREDLYYRLCVVPIIVPPLRQRGEDIPVLAAHFLERSNRKCHKRVRGFSDAAMCALVAHSWPGNVRELENIVERAVVLTLGDVIEIKDLMWLGPVGADSTEPNSGPGLRDVEREYVLRVVRECGGNRTAAARKLGIDRKTLWRKIRDPI